MHASQPLHARLVLPCALAVLLAACTERGPTEALYQDDIRPPQTTALHPLPAVALPFHLDADAALAGQMFAPDFGPPNFGRSDFDGRCSVPSDYVVSFDLWGRATHLGKFTGTAGNCGQVDFQTGGSTLSDGVLVLTAADGDVLNGVYERGGQGEDALEDHTFVGGTGRFAEATGQALGDARCDRVAGTCVFTMDGEISYGAAAAIVH